MASFVNMQRSTSEGNTIRALIIGGGVAGTTCASTLAAHHPNMSVTLIDPAPGLKIATKISRITRTAHDINMTTETAELWCRKQGITFVRGVAERLTGQAVHTGDGGVHEFDVCCIATGARPVLPEGLRNGGEFVYMLRDTDSVERLKERVRGVKRVIVVGAGGIGMEVVYELEGCEVFWVVKGHIGGTFLDARLGALLAGVGEIGSGCEGRSGNGDVRGATGDLAVAGSGVGPDWLGARDGPLLIDKGVVVSEKDVGRLRGGGGGKDVKMVNAEVVRVTREPGRDDGVRVHISDGTSIWCDMIIVGAGVIPNTEWVRTSGILLDADGGVITKCGNMETSLENVYAAGDCTHMIEGGRDWSQMRVWSQAFISGRAAGAGMGRVAGGEGYAGLEFEVFAHATQLFGKKIVLLGRFDTVENGQVYERFDDDGGIVRVLVTDGRVRGAILVGDVDCAEVFENLIISGLYVGFLGASIVEKDVELDDFFD